MRRLLLITALAAIAGCIGDDAGLSSAVAVSPVTSSQTTTPQTVSGTDIAQEPAAVRSDTPLRAPRPDQLQDFTGDLGDGELTATIVTNHGSIRCRLFEDRAPQTVANFVGLARGLQPWRDPTSKRVVDGRPFYDGLTFHRVVSGFVIQGGDPEGNSRGGPGYQFPNEHPDDRRTFDRAGLLGMANAGRDTNGSQFFITLGAFPHLNGKFTLFGECDVETPQIIGATEVETGSAGERSTPVSPVVIRTVKISRD